MQGREGDNNQLASGKEMNDEDERGALKCQKGK
jgi:hypothetical protein